MTNLPNPGPSDSSEPLSTASSPSASSSSFGDTLFKRCIYCKEVMPLYEQMCYCGGPVMVVNMELDKKKVSHSYLRRKLLFGLRGGDE